MSSSEGAVPETATSTKETESISFRLNQNDLKQLRELAVERKESLNSLVSQIIDKYLKLWVFDHSYGFFSIGKGVLRPALAKLSDNEIQEIAEEQVSKVHRAIIMNLYGKITKEVVIDYLEIFATRFVSFKHFRGGRRHTLTVFHDVDSIQFSKLYYCIASSILGLAKIEPIESERDIGTNNLAISFDASI
jgi:hypothetical protein